MKKEERKNDQFADRAPYWDSPDKIKMAESFVNEIFAHITPQPEWRALEIGAGTGLVGLQILPKVNSMVFIDTSESMLSELRKKTNGLDSVKILHGESEDYMNKDIDFIFSNMSFHHIVDIPALLTHLHKITLPGAKVAIGDLRSEDGSFHHFKPIPHKGFDTDLLSKQFEEAGFEVEIVKTYKTLKRRKNDSEELSFEQFILIAQKI